MAKKFMVTTEHVLRQKLVTDEAGREKQQKSIEKLRRSTQKALDDMMAAQEQYASKATGAHGAFYKKLAGLTEASNKELIAGYNRQLVVLKQIEESKLRIAKAGYTSPTGGSATTSTANAGGSSVQGGLTLGAKKAQVAVQKTTAEVLGLNTATVTLGTSVSSTGVKLAGLTGTTKTVEVATKKTTSEMLGLNKATVTVGNSAAKTSGQLKGLTGGVKKTSGAIESQTVSMKKHSKATKEATADSHGFFSTLKRAAVTVPAFYGMATAILAVHSAIATTVEMAVQFDTATRTLAAVLSGQGLAATRQATSEFINLSTVIGGTISDYEEAALLLARSGIGDIIIDDLTKAVGITAKLSLITGENLELAASAIITFRQAYSKGADGLEAYGGSIGDIGDKIAYMANASKLSLQDIGTFSNYAVSAGKAAGLTQDALNGMAIAFSNAGNKASTIGTQIRRFTATLTSDRDAVVNLYETIGVNRTKLNIELQKSKSGLKEDIISSNAAFAEFVRSVSSLDQVGYNQATAGMAILDKQFFDNLRNNSTEILTNVEDSFGNVSGALDKTGIIADSLANRWQAMGNSMILSSHNVATATAEAGTTIAESFLAELNLWSSLVESLAELDVRATSAAHTMKRNLGLINDYRDARDSLLAKNTYASEEEKKQNNKKIQQYNNLIALTKEQNSIATPLSDTVRGSKEQAKYNLQYLILGVKKKIARLDEETDTLQLAPLKDELAHYEAKIVQLNNIKDISIRNNYIQEEALKRFEEWKTANGTTGIVGKEQAELAKEKLGTILETIKAELRLNAAKAASDEEVMLAKKLAGLGEVAKAEKMIGDLQKKNADYLGKEVLQINNERKGASEEESANIAIQIVDMVKLNDLRNAAVESSILQASLTKESSDLLGEGTKAAAARRAEIAVLLGHLAKINTIISANLGLQEIQNKQLKEQADHLAIVAAQVLKIESTAIKSRGEEAKTLVLLGKSTKERVAAQVAQLNLTQAQEKQQLVQKAFNDLSDKGAKSRKDVEEIVKAYGKVEEANLAVKKQSNALLIANTNEATALAEETRKAAQEARNFASAMGAAINSYNTAKIGLNVSNGVLSEQQADYLLQAGRNKKAQEGLNAVLLEQKELALKIHTPGLSIEVAKKYKQELKDTKVEEANLRGKIREEEAATLDLQVKYKQKNIDMTAEQIELEARRVNAEKRLTTRQAIRIDKAKGEEAQRKRELSTLKLKRDEYKKQGDIQSYNNKIKAKEVEIEEAAQAVHNAKIAGQKRGASELERMTAIRLASLKEINKQELLNAQIAAGAGGYSKAVEADLMIGFVEREIELQRILVNEAKEAATTPRLKLLHLKAVTTELELQLELIGRQKDKEDEQLAFDQEFRLDAPEFANDVFNPYEALIKSQQEYAKNIREAGGDQSRIDKINAKNTQTQIKGYGALLGGLKGYMNEGSKSYKGLASAQKALQALEFAHYAKKQLMELDLLSVKLGAIAVGTEASVASSAVAGAASAPAAVVKGAEQGGFYGVAAMGLIVAALGFGIGASGSTVSQADIDGATGRTDYDDNSFAEALDRMEDTAYPMLETTNKMYRHLRSMDQNFASVARAITGGASSGGVDLTGVNFVDTFSEGFAGFSSKSVSLISTGLSFALQELGDILDEGEVSVRGYTTTLVEKSSWWGLSSSSSIRKSFQTLPDAIVTDMAKTFASGFELVMSSGVSLGLDAIDLEEALRASDINLGDIDFTGLSPDEVSDRLSQAFSTAFSTVITDIEAFDTLIARYAQGAEYATDTLTRIALEFDQSNHMFGLIGKEFTDAVMYTTDTWTETTSTWVANTTNTLYDASGTWIGWSNWFLGSFVTTTETFTAITEHMYSAQMQMLDIVESTGGLESFTDAMSAFMGSFYSEEEQLEFLTKSMEQSFATLGLVMPETNAAFRELLENMSTATPEGAYLYGQVLLLAEGFAEMTDASDALNDSVTSVADAIGAISDAWLSELSYLTNAQKTLFASEYSQLAGINPDDSELNAVDAARAAAETALTTSATKEEYIPVFDRYIAALEAEAPEATLDDVMIELREITLAVKELEDTTIRIQP